MNAPWAAGVSVITVYPPKLMAAVTAYAAADGGGKSRITSGGIGAAAEVFDDALRLNPAPTPAPTPAHKRRLQTKMSTHRGKRDFRAG